MLIHRLTCVVQPVSSLAMRPFQSVSTLTVLFVLLAVLPLLTLSTNVPLQTVEELTPAAPRTLVLSTQLPTIRHSHSHLFSQLINRDHTLTFLHPYDEHVRLSRHGVPTYDNILLFTEGMDDFADSLTVDQLTSYVDEGHNLVLMLGGGRVSEPVRLLCSELGVLVAEDEEWAVDHFHVTQELDRSATDGGRHAYIYSSNVVHAPIITGNGTAPIVYHGLPHSHSLAASTISAQLYIPILRAEPTAESSTDSTPILVSAYQTRSNTRVLFTASSDICSNAFAAASVTIDGQSQRSGNAELCENLIAWTFREQGVLRSRQLTHHQVGSSDINPHSYRVSDYTSFSIVIEQYNGSTHSWQPFIAQDIPLSFTMIDPYIRHPLTPHSNGSYTSQFQVPDVYGVYKYVVEYARTGYSSLTAVQQVSVTPYRHDQYERFLWVAYPYYVSALTLMGAFVLFGWVFLYGKDEPTTTVGIANGSSAGRVLDGRQVVEVQKTVVTETEVRKVR